MSSDKVGISRRSVLAGLGTVGLASAAAGLGTTAYLNDTESFEGNAITAGTLDLRVDWQQKYDGPNGPVFVNAHPDTDDDGEQSIEVQRTKHGEKETISYSDRSANLVNVLSCNNLTDEYAADFKNSNNPNQQHLVELSDVKPGDSGEITFSLHLCGNPGYIWMNARNVSYSGGAAPEPERADEGMTSTYSMNNPDDTSSLAKDIDVELWYDTNCNNVHDEQSDLIDVMLLFDGSGSLDSRERTVLKDAVENFVGQLSTTANAHVGQLSFRNDQLDHFQPLQPASSYTPDLPHGGGNTPTTPALDVAQQELTKGTSARPGADKYIVLFTDGGPNYDELSGYSVDSGGSAYTAPRSADWTLDGIDAEYDVPNVDDSTVTKTEEDELAKVAGLVREAGTTILTVNTGNNPFDHVGSNATRLDVYLETQVASPGAYFDASVGDLPNIVDDLAATVVAPEKIIFSGSLAAALGALSSGDGIALDGDTRTDGRTCFSPNRSHCIGLRWELPIETGNEVQGDGALFDLGFSAVQCRHNPDGNATAE